MRKGPSAEAERDASQHAVGGIARVFFPLLNYSSFQAFFHFCVSTSALNTTRRTKRNDVKAGNNYKREGKEEPRATERGGTFCSIFVVENAPGTFFIFVSRPVHSTRPDQQSEAMSRQEITIKEKANKNQELRNVGAPSALFLLWKTPRVLFSFLCLDQCTQHDQTNKAK